MLEHSQENFSLMQQLMKHKDVIVDSAVIDNVNSFFDKIFCEGGDDSTIGYDSQSLAIAMAASLTNEDINEWDEIDDNTEEGQEQDLQFYFKIRDRIFEDKDFYAEICNKLEQMRK